MNIWVDADACPLIVKNILYRAAARTQTLLILVSNQFLQTPPSPFIRKVRVSAGFDKADQEIVDKMCEGDLVITADIPLADAVVEKGGIALNPRGELYSTDNIKQRRSIRDFNEQLRSTGVRTGGPSKLTQKEIQNFANCLDKILQQNKRPLS